MFRDSLRLTEIFYSLQGETCTVGWPTVFIRLTGCPLRCQYCDTAYAFSGGNRFSIEEILAQVANYTPNYVTVTGGEPLAQPACLFLLKQLCDQSYFVSLETSGALPINEVDSRVLIVLDIKTPGSKECEKNDFKNLNYLKSTDQIKFVICDREDYEWSKMQLKKYQLDSRCGVLFSASYNQLSDTVLANWILEDRLPVRLQIQLHKYLWGDKRGV